MEVAKKNDMDGLCIERWDSNILKSHMLLNISVILRQYVKINNLRTTSRCNLQHWIYRI